MKRDTFIFFNPGKLIDGELQLLLVRKSVPTKKGYLPCYEFEMKDTKTKETMGHIHLRVGFNENIRYGGNIGYGVAEKFRGRRFASRGVQLLFPLAKKHGINPLWITCNPENAASRRTCELAGGVLAEIVDLPKHNEQYREGARRKCRYRFDL